jgi:hypothetical protein
MPIPRLDTKGITPELFLEILAAAFRDRKSTST